MSDSRAPHRRLPVIMPAVPDQRWSCHSCGQCCRMLVGHLFDADRERIDKQNWADTLGVAPYVLTGRGWALNKRPDGACVFLDESGLCRIHARYGEAAKPLACRIFPFSLRKTRRRWQVSLRFDCPSVTSSKGKPISDYRPWLGDLAKQLGRCETGPSAERTVTLQRGVAATTEEVDEVIDRFVRWIEHDDLPMMQRLIGAARITTTLHRATLKKVRGSRLFDLLDLLFAALPAESAVEPAPATSRQRGLLRQLAFAHAEHVSLAEVRQGLPGKARRRFQQLRQSRRFLAGKGVAPRLLGFEREARFEAIESVKVAASEADQISHLLLRYVSARLQSRSTMGAAYYDWPVLGGLTALWLSVVAAGWLARYAAAAGGRTTATFDDIARGVGMVDRAATRLPALGTLAERARVSYLLSEDGVARLTHAFAPLSDRVIALMRSTLPSDREAGCERG